MTVVLVHGGGATGRFWDRLVPHLDGPVLAVDLPGRGAHPADLGTITVAGEVASVVADIETGTDDHIVLVAHSSGGLVVPGVVRALDGRVVQVVLSAALVPPEGGRGLECMQPRHAEGLSAAFEAVQAAGGDPIVLPRPADPEQLRATYGGDPLDDETLAFVADHARSVPDTVHHYFQPVHWSAAAGVPVTYVLNTRDRPIPPGLQEEMITRLPDPPRVVRLDCGHIPAVTHASELAREIPTA